jgi:hypothetical protein
VRKVSESRTANIADAESPLKTARCRKISCRYQKLADWSRSSWSTRTESGVSLWGRDWRRSRWVWMSVITLYLGEPGIQFGQGAMVGGMEFRNTADGSRDFLVDVSPLGGKEHSIGHFGWTVIVEQAQFDQCVPGRDRFSDNATRNRHRRDWNDLNTCFGQKGWARPFLAIASTSVLMMR